MKKRPASASGKGRTPEKAEKSEKKKSHGRRTKREGGTVHLAAPKRRKVEGGGGGGNGAEEDDAPTKARRAKTAKTAKRATGRKKREAEAATKDERQRRIVRSRAADGGCWMTRLPASVVAHAVAPFLATHELVRLQSTCVALDACAAQRMRETQARVLPRIEWACNGNTMGYDAPGAGRGDDARRVCRHSTPWVNALRPDDNTIGFECRCRVRRFVPVIKRTVNGNDTMRRYAWASPCLCLAARNTNGEYRQPPTSGTLSELDRKSLMVTCQWTASAHKIDEWIHVSHVIRARQAAFRYDASVMTAEELSRSSCPSSSSSSSSSSAASAAIDRIAPLACTLYKADAPFSHRAEYSGPPDGAGACTFDASQEIPIGADRNYRICGTFCWYLDPRKSERAQFYALLDTVRNKLLDERHGGMRNELIRTWLLEKGMLHLFDFLTPSRPPEPPAPKRKRANKLGGGGGRSGKNRHGRR